MFSWIKSCKNILKFTMIIEGVNGFGLIRLLEPNYKRKVRY